MTHSARRINALAEGLKATSYLEIGVWMGTTFRDVGIAFRTGVDPKFAFDTSKVADETTQLIEKTSDGFFATQVVPQDFDVIFLDGLHTFEQTARDFSNAVLNTHRRSAILVDDTLPNDVYSTIRVQKEAIMYREAAGGTNRLWHGDVFKLVFYIHDFWPGLNYRTITNNGNPQTLVWRQAGLHRAPRFNDLERISRLDYFDLQKNMDVLFRCTEEEAIRLCLESLT